MILGRRIEFRSKDFGFNPASASPRFLFRIKWNTIIPRSFSTLSFPSLFASFAFPLNQTQLHVNRDNWMELKTKEQESSYVV